MKIRKAALAGAWYPTRASQCLELMEDFSREAKACPCKEGPVGGIVPHAGWVYSGRTAFNVVACLAQGGRVDTVLLLGRHLHPGSPASVMSQGAWDTPLGPVEVDREVAVRLVREASLQEEDPRHYEMDNTMELQLPFIKHFFPETRILPLALPPRKTSIQLAETAARLCLEAGRRACVLGSTDLTHYGYNYGFVPKGTGEEALRWVKEVNDRRVIECMLRMEETAVLEEGLQHHNACCPGAAAGAVAAAKVLGAKRAEELLYTTSYDVRPDTSFVGYVGILFCKV